MNLPDRRAAVRRFAVIVLGVVALAACGGGSAAEERDVHRGEADDECGANQDPSLTTRRSR